MFVFTASVDEIPTWVTWSLRECASLTWDFLPTCLLFPNQWCKRALRHEDESSKNISWPSRAFVVRNLREEKILCLCDGLRLARSFQVWTNRTLRQPSGIVPRHCVEMQGLMPKYRKMDNGCNELYEGPRRPVWLCYGDRSGMCYVSDYVWSETAVVFNHRVNIRSWALNGFTKPL
jgi:hypothetical protein